MELMSRPDDDSPWYRVRTERREPPFHFRPEHPRSFKFQDFAIWAAFHPDEAARLFSPSLLDSFAGSWRSLLSLLGLKTPCCSAGDFVIREDLRSPLVAEFRFWGNLFSAIWAVPGLTEEPLLFKLVPPACRSWAAAKLWMMPDTVTPRTYTFNELSQAPRVYVPLNEESDDPWEEVPNTILAAPNIGPQLADDPMELLVLMPGYGFDASGSITHLGTTGRATSLRPSRARIGSS
jgi:hypothetical protein